MLKRVEIKNFKSIKEWTSIEFDSTNYKILQNRNVASNELLKGAIFVGGNASGKTNLIMTIKVLLDLLFSENFINLASSKCIFSDENDIELNYEFLIEDETIDYKIKYNVKEKKMFEKLFLNNKMVLNRTGNSAESDITEKRYFDDLDHRTLLLRSIYFNTKFNDFHILKKWFDFLLNSVYLDGYMGIGLNYKKNDLNLINYLEEYGVSEINEFFETYNFNQKIEFDHKSEGQLSTFEIDGEKLIFFKRRGVEEPIPYMFESLGNKNLLNMLPSFFSVIKTGGILLIDEFSSAFHNELEELLIKYFMEHAKHSQMIIVSHSTNLLSNTIFRPDQSYAVSFDGIEGTNLKRFSDEKPRELQNIEKMYLNGLFGGKPYYEN